MNILIIALYVLVKLKAHRHLFYRYHFYDLKITFGYTGLIPENVMLKYTQEVRVF